MLIGEQYYRVDNDIKQRKIMKKVNGYNQEETWKANNKLAHATYKNQVDEKVAYLLTKPVTFKPDDDGNGDRYVDLIKDILGKYFQYQLSRLGYEASNKGIAWLHVYINPSGDLRTMVIP